MSQAHTKKSKKGSFLKSDFYPSHINLPKVVLKSNESGDNKPQWIEYLTRLADLTENICSSSISTMKHYTMVT